MTEAFGGGIYRYIVELCNHLTNYADLTLFYTPRKELPKDYQKDFDPRIHLICYEKKTNQKTWKFLLRGFHRFREVVEMTQPDVIHLHSSIAGVWGRWAYVSIKRPIFYTPHGYAFLNGKPKARMLLYWSLERISAIRHCTIIACGQQEYQISKKFRKDSLCVFNGINIEQMREVLRKVRSEDSHRFRVVTVGRNAWQKNPKLFNAIAEHFPDTEFVWLGDDNPENLTASNIKLLGFLDYEETLQQIRLGNIFLLTSVFEGLAYSLLEAMALKCVCVVSDTPGNQNVIESGVNGFVCGQLNDYVDIIQKIQKKQCYDFDQIRENAYQTVCHKYSSEKMAEQYLQIYEKSLANNYRKSGESMQ